MCSNLFLIIKKLEESFLFLVIHYLWEIQTEPSVLFFIAVCFYIITDQQLRLQKDTKKAVYVCVFVFIHAQPLIIFWLLSSPIYLATVLYFTKLKNLQTFNSQKKKKNTMAMPQQHRESRSGVSIGASNGFFSLSRAQIISTYYLKNLNIIQTLSIIFYL